MKKSLELTIFLLCLVLGSFGAFGQWAATYDGGGDDSASSIQQIADGGYIISGSTESFGMGRYDLWILELDSNGNIIWQKTYGGGEDDYIPCIDQTADGGYIVGSTTYSFGPDWSNIWVLKLNGDGDIIWQKTYGVGSEYLEDISQTTDGGYIVAGYTISFGAGSFDIWILKLDSNGNITWQKTYGGSEWDQPSSIRQTADEGYIVTAWTESFGGGYSNSDIWILKLDSIGNIEWQKTYGGGGNDYDPNIDQTIDGGYIVNGSTSSFGSGSSDVWVLRLDSNGNIIWQTTYGGSGFDEGSSIQQVADGGYILAGTTNSFGAGNGDAWILKLDAVGNVTWQRTYGYGNYVEGVGFIQETGDGGYITVGGSSYHPEPDVFYEDILVLKVDGNGDIDPSCRNFIGNTTISSQPSFGATTNTNVAFSNTDVTPSNTTATAMDTNVSASFLCRAPVPPEGWPMFHHDPNRTGYTDSPAPSAVDEANLVWRYTTGGSVRSSPAVADNKVFIGSDDHKIYALAASSGQLIWEYPVGPGGIVESSPAVADGMVIVGVYDGILRALDKDNGSYIWGKSLGDIFSSSVIADGLVFVGTLSGKMYALYANTGDIKWEKSFAEQIFSSPAVADGKVFFGSGSYPSAGKLYCLLADSGDSCPGWSGPFSPVPSGAVVSSPAVADGKVFFGCNNGWVYALDQDNGSLVWSFETGGLVSSSPAIADGLVFVSSKDGNLYAFDADPSDGVDEGNNDPPGGAYDLIWSQNIGEAGIDLSSSPAVADGKVFIGSYDHKIYTFDASDGSLISTYQTDGPIWSSPAIQGGMLYIGSEDHNIYAFGEPGGVCSLCAHLQGVISADPIIGVPEGCGHFPMIITKVLHYSCSGLEWIGEGSQVDICVCEGKEEIIGSLEVGDEVEVCATYDPALCFNGWGLYVGQEGYISVRKAALPAAQDAYVSSIYPNENFGFDDSLNVFNYGHAYERSYLQFDLCSLPDGVEISKAELQLSLRGLDGEDEIGAYRVSFDWGESQITWNNQPPAASTPESSTLVSYDQPAGEFVWDVTNLARTWKDSPSQNHGIMLRSTSEPASTGSCMDFYSREESVYIEKTPKLVLYFSAETSVNFPDPNLEQAIRETIDKPTGDIYDSDLVGLTELYASERGISNLTGLEHCTDLEYVDLAGNQISDISALAMLTKLQVAALLYNQIVDVAPLSGLTSLLGLALNANQISDITSLSALTNLVLLWLDNNNISDITPLAGLTHLGDDPYSATSGTMDKTTRGQEPVANPDRLSAFYRTFRTVPDQTATSRDDACDYPALGLSNNLITDIQPLVNNSGIGTGDVVNLRENFLDLTPGSQDMQNIQDLQGRGTTVCYEPQCLTPAVFRVEGSTGNVYSDASYYGKSFETGSADVAEWMPVSEPVEPGDVLELDPCNPGQYRKARGPCSDLVAGVVSSDPGVILGSGIANSLVGSSTVDVGRWTLNSALLALIGIVPVKVTDEGGPIQPGDLLVTSSTPGYAMRWDPDTGSPCALVGKALEPLEEGSGIILVLLTSH